MFIILILGTITNVIVFLLLSRFLLQKSLKGIVIYNYLLAFILCIFCLYEIGYLNEIISINFYNWINIGFLKIKLGLLIDSLTIIMVSLVLFISSLVHIYSLSYMKNDPHLNRFIAYLSLFTFFMLILVTSNNFLQLLIGWEGVGLSSYLLICFWYTRIAANLAAIKAMLINRIGDICLLFAIFLIYSFFGSVQFGLVFNNIIYYLDYYIDVFFFEIRFIDLICFFLFVGAMGKSAQLLLHIWLPDAMEGPTPVSALIHAATMVTAGIFLVIRCSFIFELSSTILFFIVFIGSLTSFLMAIIGAFQLDIKKVVAYSTASQLGYMFMACGLSNYNVAFFHLFTHAFFKALLFLSMGVIIHALADEQDFRKMGSLINFLPLTSVMVFFGSYALLGLPFLAGFFSKDMLLEVAFIRLYLDGYFSYFLGLSAAFFTSFYSTRLFIRIFFSYSNVIRNYMFNIHEADIFMYIPLIILLFCSFFIGYFFFDMFVGLGSYFFFDSIFINMQHYSGFLLEFELNNINKLMPLFITLLGFFFYYLLDNRLYLYYYNINYRNIYYIFYFGLFFDKFYVEKLLSFFYYFCYESYYKNIEVGFFQKYNIVIFAHFFFKIYQFFRQFSVGFFYLYILLVVFFLFSSICFFLFNLGYLLIILIFLCFYMKFTIIDFYLKEKNFYFLKQIYILNDLTLEEKKWKQ